MQTEIQYTETDGPKNICYSFETYTGPTHHVNHTYIIYFIDIELLK